MLARGDRGAMAKEAQEWLSLHGFEVSIDGIFGPATEQAIVRFQSRCHLPAAELGQVGRSTWAYLRAPLIRARSPASTAARDYPDLVLLYAYQHHRWKPREVGGANRGPWVRHYTRGYEGAVYKWCAGFVSTILAQAAQHATRPPPLRFALSCNALAAEARAAGILVAEASDAPQRGWLFLKRTGVREWHHVGIVIDAGPGWIETIEGNIGDAVGKRTRSLASIDFIRIED